MIWLYISFNQWQHSSVDSKSHKLNISNFVWLRYNRRKIDGLSFTLEDEKIVNFSFFRCISDWNQSQKPGANVGGTTSQKSILF